MTTVSVDRHAMLVAALLALITTVTSLPASDGSMHDTNDAVHGRGLSAAPCPTARVERSPDYRTKICGKKGSSCPPGFEADHRVECQTFNEILEMMFNAGTMACPKKAAMDSFNEHITNSVTNLKAVPK